MKLNLINVSADRAYDTRRGEDMVRIRCLITNEAGEPREFFVVVHQETDSIELSVALLNLSEKIKGLQGSWLPPVELDPVLNAERN